MKVNVLALSSPARFELENLSAGLKQHREIWQEKGIVTELYPSCYVQNYYETLTPEQKANELLEVAKKNQQVIVSLRGGYSTNFILEYLDYEQLNQYNNTIIGHSDLTILLNHLAFNTDWQVYHGPLFTSVLASDNYSLPQLTQCIEQKETVFHSQLPLMSYNQQKMSGVIIGGNLSLITMAIGTKYELDLSGKIVLIEDVNEPDFKIDAMFWQLVNHYDLSKVKGFIIGSFEACNWEQTKKHRGVKTIILNYLLKYNKPIHMNFSSSHYPVMTSLPLNQWLEVDENGLIIRR